MMAEQAPSSATARPSSAVPLPAGTVSGSADATVVLGESVAPATVLGRDGGAEAPAPASSAAAAAGAGVLPPRPAPRRGSTSAGVGPRRGSSVGLGSLREEFDAFRADSDARLNAVLARVEDVVGLLRAGAGVAPSSAAQGAAGSRADATPLPPRSMSASRPREDDTLSWGDEAGGA